MKVNIDELQIAANKLFNNLKNNGIKEIELDNDFYWFIHKDDRYDSYNKPDKFTMGQISSDYENLLKITKQNDSVVNFGFVWLSSILLIIGEENS